MRRIERELRSAVLQGEPELAGDHLRSEVLVDALDERHAVPFPVDRGEVGRVAAQRISRRQPGASAARIDEHAPLGGVGLRNQLVHGDAHLLGVGDETGAIGPGDLLRLDEEMPEIGGAGAEAAQVEALEQVEHLQRGDSLAGRGQLPDAHAAVVRADRVDPGRRRVGEVVGREQPAGRLRESDELAGDPPPVERVAATARQLAVGGRQSQVAEDLSSAWRAARRQVSARRVGVRRQVRLARLPHPGDHLAHREALFRDGDGGFQQLGERARSEAGAQRFPSVDRARHRPRERTGGGQLGKAARSHLLQGGAVGRAAAGVEPEELPGAGFPHHREEIAADAAGHRLDHSEHEIRGDGRVHGIPAAAQDVDPGLHRERLAGGDHPMHRVHGGPAHAPRAADMARGSQRRICGHRTSLKVPQNRYRIPLRA